MTNDLSTSKRVSQLDGLRGVAILLVLGLHYISDVYRGGFGTVLYRVGSAFRLGWCGVDLFFVLSGFLIGGILLEARNAKNYFAVFYARRFFRIVPIYYIWLSILVGLILACDKWIARIMVPGESAVRLMPFYYFFMQNYLAIPFGSFVWIWLAPTWSLAIEEQFYLFMPPLIRYLATARLKAVLLMTILLSPAVRALVFLVLPGGKAAIYTWTLCRADTLAVGVMASLLWREGQFQRWYSLNHRFFKLALLFLLAGIPVFIKWFPSPYGLLMGGVGYSWLAILFAGLLLTSLVEPAGAWSTFLQSKLLRELGKLSYCIYLIHLATLHLLHHLFLHSLPSINNAAGAGVSILALALTLIFAKCSWTFLEAPLIRRGHRFSYSHLEEKPAVCQPSEANKAVLLE